MLSKASHAISLQRYRCLATVRWHQQSIPSTTTTLNRDRGSTATTSFKLDCYRVVEEFPFCWLVFCQWLGKHSFLASFTQVLMYVFSHSTVFRPMHPFLTAGLTKVPRILLDQNRALAKSSPLQTRSSACLILLPAVYEPVSALTRTLTSFWLSLREEFTY